MGATKFGSAAPELLGNVLDGLRVDSYARAGNKVVGEDALAVARDKASMLKRLGATIDEVTAPVDWIEEQVAFQIWAAPSPVSPDSGPNGRTGSIRAMSCVIAASRNAVASVASRRKRWRRRLRRPGRLGRAFMPWRSIKRVSRRCPTGVRAACFATRSAWP